MRRISLLFIVLGLMCFSTGNAQSLTIHGVKDVVRQGHMNHRQLNTKKGGMVDLSAIDGSPYWHPNFERGKVLITQGGKTKTVNGYIRYRVFDDIFEVKERRILPDSKIMNLQRSKDISILLDHKKFVLLKHLPIKIRGVRNGYAMVLVSPQKEGKAALYKRLSQEFIPAKKPKSSYDSGRKARLKEQDYFFVKINHRLYQIEPNRRKAYRGFPDHQKALKKFIKKNRLKFRKKRVNSDMIQLVNYYNTLQ